MRSSEANGIKEAMVKRRSYQINLDFAEGNAALRVLVEPSNKESLWDVLGLPLWL